jgi:hypothetical protein
LNRTVVTAATLVAIGTLALPSSAAPKKKPITKTYTATAVPSGVGLTSYCDGLPTTTDKHLEAFKAPAAGSLKVALTGATGDWDALLLDSAGSRVAYSATLGPGDEAYTYKIKKAASYTLMSCNGLGGPTATVKYTFTYK